MIGTLLGQVQFCLSKKGGEDLEQTKAVSGTAVLSVGGCPGSGAQGLFAWRLLLTYALSWFSQGSVLPPADSAFPPLTDTAGTPESLPRAATVGPRAATPSSQLPFVTPSVQGLETQTGSSL